jgi:hypothetical protein
MRAEARAQGLGEPVSLRELEAAASEPRIFHFDHTNDVVPCSNATTTLEWRVGNADRVVLTDEQGDTDVIRYDDDGTHDDDLEVGVQVPPHEFELEAVSSGDGASAVATTTVGTIPDGRSYLGTVVVYNPRGSGATYDVVLRDGTETRQLGTLSPDERIVVDEDELSRCVTYRLVAVDGAGTLRGHVSFVFVPEGGRDLWNLPAASP